MGTNDAARAASIATRQSRAAAHVVNRRLVVAASTAFGTTSQLTSPTS